MRNESLPARAEVAVVTVVCWIAATVTMAYLVDLAGLTIRPAIVLPPALAVGLGATAGLWRRARPDPAATAGALGVMTAALAWFFWMAWPSLLPLGAGPDLVHHLGLIRYIETHLRLVHDPAVEQWLGEMVSYTPGSHLLVALAARLLGSDGLRLVHPVMAMTVVLKIGLVFLIVMRMCAGQRSRLALSVAGILLLWLPRSYVLGSFTHDSFLAQVVSETFALAMWWALVEWDASPSVPPLAVFALCGAAAFLTWPIWIGPLILALMAIVVWRQGVTWGKRVLTVAAAVGPVALLATAYMIARLAWTAIVRTSGAVVAPSPATVGWTFIVLATFGLAAALTSRRQRVTVVLLGAMALQAVVLFAIATSAGAHTPYLAYKMAYLAVYPLAVLAIGGVAVGLVWFDRAASRHWNNRLAAIASVSGSATVIAAWLVAAAIGLVAMRSELRAPAPTPVVSIPMQRAAQWLRTRGTMTCVDYIADSWVTAYWLHVVELGNPRLSARTGDITDTDLYERSEAEWRWVDPHGPFQFAILDDFDRVYRDARTNMKVLFRFGPAAVVKRRAAGACPDAPKAAAGQP